MPLADTSAAALALSAMLLAGPNGDTGESVRWAGRLELGDAGKTPQQVDLDLDGYSFHSLHRSRKGSNRHWAPPGRPSSEGRASP